MKLPEKTVKAKLLETPWTFLVEDATVFSQKPLIGQFLLKTISCPLKEGLKIVIFIAFGGEGG